MQLSHVELFLKYITHERDPVIGESYNLANYAVIKSDRVEIERDHLHLSQECGSISAFRQLV